MNRLNRRSIMVRPFVQFFSLIAGVIERVFPCIFLMKLLKKTPKKKIIIMENEQKNETK